MKIFKVLNFIINEPSNKGQRLKRILYAIGWQIWKRTIKKPLIIDLDNGMKYIAFTNTPMGSFPVYARVYDSKNILFLRRKFKKNNGIMIDVGANMGIYSLLLNDNFKKFILFEPIRETAKICEINMKLNSIDYELYNIALGNEKGEIKFQFKGNFDSTAKIERKEGNYKVRIDKLDDIIDKKLYKDIKFMKIDVEGFELEVLKGAENIIRESSIELIQFERLKTTPIEPLLKFFKDRKWQIFTLDSKGNLSYSQELINNSHDLFAIREI